MAYRRKINRPRVVINSRPIKADKQAGLCEKHFWIFAFGVILISILTRVFDFSLKPVSYKGLFINWPYCGLHSWANANRAWAAGNHLIYTLESYKWAFQMAGPRGRTRLIRLESLAGQEHISTFVRYFFIYFVLSKDTPYGTDWTSVTLNEPHAGLR